VTVIIAPDIRHKPTVSCLLLSVV